MKAGRTLPRIPRAVSARGDSALLSVSARLGSSAALTGREWCSGWWRCAFCPVSPPSSVQLKGRNVGTCPLGKRARFMQRPNLSAGGDL